MNIFTKHLKIRLKIFINLGTRSSNLTWYKVPEKHYYKIIILFCLLYNQYNEYKKYNIKYINNINYIYIIYGNNLSLKRDIKSYLFLYNNNMYNFFSFKKNIKAILFNKLSLYFLLDNTFFKNINTNIYIFSDFIIWIHCSNIRELFLLKKKDDIILNSFLNKLMIHKNHCLYNSFYFIENDFDIALCEILNLYLKNINYFMYKFNIEMIVKKTLV